MCQLKMMKTPGTNANLNTYGDPCGRYVRGRFINKFKKDG